MQKQEISMLCLARKAGKIILGFDKVVEEMKNGHIKGVFYTMDLSPKSAKELCFESQKYGLAPLSLQISMEEVSHALGKRSGVIALTDEGFAKKIATYHVQEPEGGKE